MNNKRVVKYQSLFNSGEVVEGHNVLVVRRMKTYKCKCHHCRINPDGFCTYGRCRHEQTNHFKTRELF